MDREHAIEGLELTAITSLLRQFKVPTLLLILLTSNWKRIRSNLAPLMSRWYYQYFQRWVVDTFTDLEIAMEKRIWKTTFYNREADDKSFWKLCPWLPFGPFNSSGPIEVREVCLKDLASVAECPNLGWLLQFCSSRANPDTRVLSHLSKDELEQAAMADTGRKQSYHYYYPLGGRGATYIFGVHPGMPVLEDHLEKQVNTIRKLYRFWPEKVPKCFLRHQVATVIEGAVSKYAITIAIGLLGAMNSVIEIDEKGYAAGGSCCSVPRVIVIHENKKHIENFGRKHITEVVADQKCLVVYLTPSLAKLSEVMPSGFYVYHLKIDGVTRGQLRKILEENQMEIDEDLIARLPDGVIPHSVLFRALASGSLHSLIDEYCPVRCSV